jgi:hypothetical protein
MKVSPVAIVTAAALGIGALAAPSARAATRYVAPGGSDGGACAPAAAPCGSIERAYSVSAPGDVVEVAGGSYPAQRVPRVDGRTGAPVEIAPAPSADVQFASLNVAGDAVTVRGIKTGFLDLDGEGAPLRNVTIVGGHGPGIWIDSADGLLIKGGSYGGNQDKPTVQFAPDPPSTDVTFDGVDFHDAVATNPSVHMECIWAGGVRRFTVRNSLFRNCAYFDIFLTTFQGGNPSDVLLESNVFETTRSWDGSPQPYGVNVANWVTEMHGLVIRNNTFESDLIIQSPVVTGARIVGNVGAFSSCKDGVQYSHNISAKTGCGSSDRVVRNLLGGFVDPAGHDWHLMPGAAAIDAGDPADAPPTDRDGKRRVGTPDAGAQEFGTPPADGAPAAGGENGRHASLLTAARLTPRSICLRARRGCKGSALARLTLARAATVRVSVQRKRGGRYRTARTLMRHAKAGKLTLRVRARGLRRGSYRVLVRASGSGAAVRRTFTLRVG